MSIQVLLAVLLALLMMLARTLMGGSATPAVPGGGSSGAGPTTLLQIPGAGSPAGGQPFGGPVNASLPKPTGGEPWNPGPGQLHGSDTSEYQSDTQFHDAIKGDQWAVIKASQGTGWTDPTFQSRWRELGDRVQSGAMALRVAYCYLDPRDGAGQARHFLDVVGVRGPLPAGTRLALDWEAAALNDPGTLRDAGQYIHQVTGLWPIVYVQGSKLSEAKSTLPEAPMWEASWGPPPNRDVPFVQYSDGPVYDHDVFNGDVDALRKFAGQS